MNEEDFVLNFNSRPSLDLLPGQRIVSAQYYRDSID